MEMWKNLLTLNFAEVDLNELALWGLVVLLLVKPTVLADSVVILIGLVAMLFGYGS